MQAELSSFLSINLYRVGRNMREEENKLIFKILPDIVYSCSLTLCLSSSFVLLTFSVVTKCLHVGNNEITQHRLTNSNFIQTCHIFLISGFSMLCRGCSD